MTVVDAGVHEPVGLVPDVGRDEVARAAGADVDALAAAGDRGAAVTAMARGRGADRARPARARRARRRPRRSAARAARRSPRAAMQALPVGVPKLIVSTVASGDTRPYVGAVDVTMMYSVVDISGINSVSARILANAAAAIAGMARRDVARARTGRPLVAATMFGVTTPCVDTRARAARGARLRGARLPRHRRRRPLDGGARRRRLPRRRARRDDDGARRRARRRRALGRARPARGRGPAGVPQVVSLGALDMVNFGPRETVPPQFEDRNLYVHNPTVTLMRTTRGGVRAARPHDRREARRGDGPDRCVRARSAASR